MAAFPPTVYKCFIFSSSSSTLVITCLFDNSHPNRWEMLSHCGFDFVFLQCLVMLEDFPYLCWPVVYLSLKNIYSVISYFQIRLFVFFAIELNFYIFWTLTPYLIYALQIFSPILRLPFHFFDCFDA